MTPPHQSAPHILARAPDATGFVNGEAMLEIGIDHTQLARSMTATYRLLDRIDAALASDGVDPLCQIVELANLSSMIGNVLATALARHSNGLYCRNGPHRYPDLLAADAKAATGGVEIKMALNRNQPKGHLAKSGHYITCRYILIDEQGHPTVERADRVRARRVAIWEVRTGFLEPQHFNISNTEGDSGKTAVVNAAGMDELKVVYVDMALLPGAERGPRYEAYRSLFRPP